MLALDPAAQDLLFRRARTANSFSPEPVADELVMAVYDLVKYAPTSMNQQPLRLVLVRSAPARQALLDQVAPGNQDKVRQSPLVVLLAADLRFDLTLPRVFPHAPNAAEQFEDPAVRRESALFNTALQVAYFIIGVRAAGLAAGPIVGYDADGINKHFFPDGDREVVTLLNIGRPGVDPWHERLPRLPFAEIATTV
jgi:3-hydroxypropanoate dehydrogenase